MKRHLMITLLVCLCALAAGATEPVTTPNWDLAEQWSMMKVYNACGSMEAHPHWLPDSDRFWYRYFTSEGRFYWLVDPEAKLREPMFDHEALAAQLNVLAAAAGLDSVAANELDLGDVTFEDDLGAFSFTAGPATCRWDRAAGALALVSVDTTGAPEVPAWLSLSPDEAYSVHQRGHDLYMVSTAALQADPQCEHTRLSSDGQRAYGWNGELIDEDDVEMHGVSAVWSPDSKYFALLRMDTREVEDLWLVDHLAQPRPTLKTYKMASPGAAVPQWELWVGDVEAGTLARVPAERWPDQDLSDLFAETLMWSEDSRQIYFTRRSRDFKSVDLCRYDIAGGEVKVLIEERLDAMVYIQAPILLPDGDVLWFSMRSGWGHYYRVDADGQVVGQLTRGDWNVAEIASLDHDNGVMYFFGIGREQGRNPYYRHLYRVGFDGTGLLLLTPDDAEHLVTVAPSHGYFVDTPTRVDMAPYSVLRDNRGEVILELEKSDISELTDRGWKAPETFTALSADRVTLQWGVMYKPFDFDPKKKYPVVTRVYPGRQGEFVPRRFWPVNPETMLANLGCIVVRFGNRGATPERGVEYREYGREEFRDYGLADKRAVIEELGARHEWIDLDRVGMFGGSSGGFMTMSAMLVDNDFYDVGVAMTAPNDPSIYYNIWFERYKGLMPVEPADGNLELADRLQGKLLMINGAQDDNVHPAQMYRMADALIKAGKRFDMFMVPGAGHGLGDWRYLYGMILDYFGEHLIGEPRSSVKTFNMD